MPTGHKNINFQQSSGALQSAPSNEAQALNRQALNSKSNSTTEHAPGVPKRMTQKRKTRFDCRRSGREYFIMHNKANNARMELMKKYSKYIDTFKIPEKVRKAAKEEADKKHNLNQTISGLRDALLAKLILEKKKLKPKQRNIIEKIFVDLNRFAEYNRMLEYITNPCNDSYYENLSKDAMQTFYWKEMTDLEKDVTCHALMYSYMSDAQGKGIKKHAKIRKQINGRMRHIVTLLNAPITTYSLKEMQILLDKLNKEVFEKLSTTSTTERYVQQACNLREMIKKKELTAKSYGVAFEYNHGICDYYSLDPVDIDDVILSEVLELKR